MFRLLPVLALLAFSGPASAQRQPIGIFSEWGAFRESEPVRCYAVAEPWRSPKPRGWRPYATISYDSRHVHGQVYFRLSRTKREGSAVLLKIDGRPFQMMAGGADAWAPDRRADAEIVAAIRAGVEMVVETRSARGALVRDRYRLRGAATAIDAAAIACATRP